ncbi:hypothetical protein [Sandaracinobacteroides saxicola]|uniref:Uncharacterized protein n=1 Tax=Sandaracinobacteroides saxicola TaxID=2759707 RepID=A0A7G5IJ13_9SPHN|nr:hypothetical protein [Sandaracinobacteroides saxicola]QMW23355.1 hypothetical protein H3309_02295 [Sandaracinobacteroides saxicola]
MTGSTPIGGFVASSQNLHGRTWAEVEEILGFNRGRFNDGGTVWRIAPGGPLEAFVNAPTPASFAALGMVIAGFNDERGRRDWSAMEKDARNNGYSVQSILRDRADYVRSAPMFDTSAAARALLLAEMVSMMACGATLVKLRPNRPHDPGREAVYQYPAGGGIREYFLVTPQLFVPWMNFGAGEAARQGRFLSQP